MARRTFSKAFERDYKFYNLNKDKFSFAGVSVSVMPNITQTKEPISAKKAFYIFDSTGKIVPCNESEEFRKLISCKKSINMQIKQWALGFEDCMQSVEELVKSFDGDVPNWVSSSLTEQVRKIHGASPEYVIHCAHRRYAANLLRNLKEKT
jgi:ribosome biogenesis GTPase A